MEIRIKSAFGDKLLIIKEATTTNNIVLCLETVKGVVSAHFNRDEIRKLLKVI